MITVVDTLLVVITSYLLYKFLESIKQRRIYPPGPKPLPLIGNLLDLPRGDDEIWMHWKKFKDSYGPIASIKILGKRLIIINDAKITFDLLDKRSKIFSDRPHLTFSGEMIGWNDSPTHMNYSERLLKHRKQFYQAIGSKDAISKFEHVREVEIRRFLLRFLDESASTKLFESIHLMIGSILLSITYGYSAEHDTNDPLIAFIEQVAEEACSATEPGKWLVDIIPILRYIPVWMPGTDFKRVATIYRRNLLAMIDIPFKFAKENIESGNAYSSLVSLLLSSGELSHEEEEIVKWSVGLLYSAGVDTTATTLRKFFLAMTLFPDIQARAQAEIDTVVGEGRFPTSKDRERLPYIDALIKEVLRWNTTVPLGLPHATSEDTEYNGYFIPKGATIITNTWGMLHDPQNYADPDNFAPERFLGTDNKDPEIDPSTLAFGFGRRVCPGREFAEATIYLCISMCLAVLNIEKPENRELKVKFMSKIVSSPMDFEVVIKPRSERYEALVRLIEDEHPLEKGSGEAIRDAISRIIAQD